MRKRTSALAASVLALALVGSGAGTQAAAPITIGVFADCLGAFASFYVGSVAGAELPLVERGARLVTPTDPAGGIRGLSVAGHPIRLVFGCGDTDTVSGLAEARRLVEALGAQVVIGPTTADEETALQEYVRRRPDITFVDGSAGGLLSAPPPNFFTFHSDARQWLAGLGSYAFHRLGWRNAVLIVNPDNFNWQQTAGFVAEFCSLGGRITKRIWLPFSTTDFAGVLTQIPRHGVDGFFVESFTKVEQSLVKNYPGLRGHSARRVLGGVWSEPGGGWWTPVRGQVIANPQGPPAALESFKRRLHRAFPRLDPALFENDYVFAPDYYGAMVATLQALVAVHGNLSGHEHRFQAALAHAQVDVPSGRIRLDAAHQAVVPNDLWRINTLDGSSRTLIRVVPRVDRTFAGYFGRRDPPPSEATPVCRTGHVPPWARSG